MQAITFPSLSAADVVCTTFVVVFAATTTMDVRWLLRRRRLRNDPCRSRS